MFSSLHWMPKYFQSYTMPFTNKGNGARIGGIGYFLINRTNQSHYAIFIMYEYEYGLNCIAVAPQPNDANGRANCGTAHYFHKNSIYFLMHGV